SGPPAPRHLGDRDLIAAASPPPPAAGAGTRTLDSSPVASRARDVASLRERRLDVGGLSAWTPSQPSPRSRHPGTPSLSPCRSFVRRASLVRDLHRRRALGEDLRSSKCSRSSAPTATRAGAR